MKLFVVRHGEYESNVLNQINSDFNNIKYLTAEGINQAEKASKILSKIKFDVCYSSQFQRTKDTLNYIIGKKKYIIDKRLNEVKTGFDGKKINNFLDFLSSGNPWSSKLEGFESFEDVKNRTFDFINFISNNSFNNVLIVTHGCILKMFKAYFEGIESIDLLGEDFKNCEILTFEINN